MVVKHHTIDPGSIPGAEKVVGPPLPDRIDFQLGL